MTPVCRCCCCCCCCQRQREEKGVSLLVSPRTKNTPEDWKRTRFCARTHTKKKQGHAYSLLLCCVIGTRRSIDSARWSIVTFWLARGGFVGPMIRERPTSRSLFFRSDFFLMHDAPQSFPLLFDRFKTRSRRRKRQTNSRRAREKTRKNTHTEKKKKKTKKKRNNDDAPVYCSTSDFTHPSNPSSNVSKNAAPSTSRLALDADADDANAATVVAHAIVFFKPQ